MENRNVKAIIRGHLISIDAECKKLEKFGDEFYRTKFWNVIVANTFVSFKRYKRLHRFNFKDITKFSLQDSKTFVIEIVGVKKKFYFEIV